MQYVFHARHTLPINGTTKHADQQNPSDSPLLAAHNDVFLKNAYEYEYPWSVWNKK